MLVQARKTQNGKHRVRSLADLMSIYECNYIRLRQLIPDFENLADRCISRADGALDIHLRVLERSKYTTTFKLTYFFSDDFGRFPAPDLQIRIYHDARLAEVLTCGPTRGKRQPAYDRRRLQYSPEEKWRINRFLQKWLGYCLRQGHRFPAGDHSEEKSWSELMGDLGLRATSRS